MKKTSIKQMVFIVSIFLITGLSGFAFANMGFGSHMGGYNGNGYHMNSSNNYYGEHIGNGNEYFSMGSGRHMYNGNHMVDSDQMGAGIYNDGHMFNNRYNQNQRNNDKSRQNNNYTNDNSELAQEYNQ